MRMKARKPGLKVLYVSGYTDHEVIVKSIIDSGDSFLHKPFTIDALRQKVREVLDA